MRGSKAAQKRQKCLAATSRREGALKIEVQAHARLLEQVRQQQFGLEPGRVHALPGQELRAALNGFQDRHADDGTCGERRSKPKRGVEAWENVQEALVWCPFCVFGSSLFPRTPLAWRWPVGGLGRALAELWQSRGRAVQ